MSFAPTFLGPSPTFFDGQFSDVAVMPYTVNLDGTDYLMDLSEYRHNGIARFREGVINSGEPNDQLYDTQGAWWRYRISWHQGADQDVADLDETGVPARFNASRGVDVWEKYKACLLNTTQEVLAVEAVAIFMAATGQHVYVSDGPDVKRSSDLITWNTVTGLAGTVTGMTTDGTSVYIATTTNIYTVAPASVASSLTTSAAAPGGGYGKVAFVSNRLIAGAANVIYEVKVATIDAVYTHFQPAFRWTAIFNVGSRIYMGGFAGNRSELYTTSTTDVGVLILAAEAASFFSGELINDALSYGGQVILATSEGVRFASLTGDGTLTYGPLLDDMGSSRCLAAQGRFVYFGWDQFPGVGCGVGRLALDEFVNTLQPAYATDVFTELDDDDIMAVARFGGRTLFAVSGAGVYATDLAAYVTEGYIDSGDITFGTVEDKSLSTMRARFAKLGAGQSVRVEISDEINAQVSAKTITTLNAEELTLELQTRVVERARVRVLLRGNGTSTPCLRQWRLRAYPIAPTTEEWLVPLIIRSQVVVNDSDGQALSMDPWVQTAHIRKLWEESRIVLYKEGDHAFRVRIDNFQIGAVEWRDGSDWMEVNCTVRLLTA